VLDPREFTHAEKSIDDAVLLANDCLMYDGYAVVREGLFFVVHDLSAGKARLETTAHTNDVLTQSVIDENIRKCEAKLSSGDFSGAITNARSLLEAVLLGLESELAPASEPYDGDLLKLYKRVQRALNLEPDRKDIADSLKQVLTGLASVINGLASLRNKMGDAHALSYRPERHHAKLAVYAATTLADFLFETRDYQRRRVQRDR
jgi:hypothetical protein